MNILINKKIADELTPTIESLSYDNDLPSVLEKIGNADSFNIGKEFFISILVNKKEIVDLIYWVVEDRDYKQEVVMKICLDDKDHKSAHKVRQYIKKCDALLIELEDLSAVA